MNLSTQADALAARRAGKSQLAWQQLRDWIDMRTGGELDCQPLDILTDMVERRLAKATGEQT